MRILPSQFLGAPDGDSNFPCLGYLKELLNCKTFRVVPPLFEIFSQGESPHTVCLICYGLVKLTRTEFDGRRTIVGLRRTGWLLGADAILQGLSYASTAETVTRSKLCFVPRDQFQQAMKTDARFSEWVSVMLSREVYASTVFISEQSCLSGRKRLEKFLLETIQHQRDLDTKKAVKILIPLKKWEMAQLLALTPEYLCRLLSQMENEGIILRKKGWLILAEPSRLLHSAKAPRTLSQSK